MGTGAGTGGGGRTSGGCTTSTGTGSTGGGSTAPPKVSAGMVAGRSGDGVPTGLVAQLTLNEAASPTPTKVLIQVFTFIAIPLSQ
ncbi:hypothetical protein D3C72_1696320 [compost metagenome]